MEIVPPAAPGGEWLTLRGAIMKEQQNGEENPAARSFAAVLFAYGKGDAQAFNRDLAAYQSYLNDLHLPEMKTIDFEVFFNHFAPFYQCTILYVCVFVLACLGFMGWTEMLGRCGLPPGSTR